MMKKVLLLCCCLALAFTFAGCGKKEAVSSTKDVALAELAARHLPGAEAMMAMPLTDLEDYLGMESDWYTEAVYLQEGTLGGDEALVLRAKDDESAKAIAACLESYLAQRLKETQNYLPEAYKVLKETGVQRKNNTLALIVTENAADVTAALLAGE